MICFGGVENEIFALLSPSRVGEISEKIAFADSPRELSRGERRLENRLRFPVDGERRVEFRRASLGQGLPSSLLRGCSRSGERGAGLHSAARRDIIMKGLRRAPPSGFCARAASSALRVYSLRRPLASSLRFIGVLDRSACPARLSNATAARGTAVAPFFWREWICSPASIQCSTRGGQCHPTLRAHRSTLRPSRGGLLYRP